MAVIDRSQEAPPPRTLVDILRADRGQAPDSAAIEDPAGALTYGELMAEVETRRQRAWPGRGPARATGWGCACRPVRGSSTSRSSPCWRPGPPTFRSTPTIRSERADLVFAEAERRGGPDRRTGYRPTGRAPPGPDPGEPTAPAPDGRRVDHLHLGLHRRAEGRRGHAPLGRGLRRRRGPAVPPRRAARARRPGAGRAVGRLRRVVRGDVARVAARRLPGAGAAFARAQRRGPRPLARPAPDHRGLDRPDAGRAVAGRGARERAAADLRRRGVPARAGCAAGRRGSRGVEHLRPDRGDRGRVRRAAGRAFAGPHRAAAGRLGARRGRRRRRPGRRRRGRRADHRRRRPGPLPRPGQGRREVRAAAVARLGARVPLRRPRALEPIGAALPRPRRRSGEGRRPPDRARRGRGRALRRCPAWTAAAVAVRRTEAGVPILVGYLVAADGLRPQRGPGPAGRDAAGRRSSRCSRVVDELPVRTSGKVDRDALPWPLPEVTEALTAVPGPTSVAGRAVAGRARHAGDRPQGRLLRPRRRLAGRRPARLPDPRPGTGVQRRRRLRPSAARGDGRPRSPTPRPTPSGGTRSASRGRPRWSRGGCRRCSACRCSSSPGRAGWSTCSPRAGSCASFAGFEFLPDGERLGAAGRACCCSSSPFGRMAIAAGIGPAAAGRGCARATIRAAGGCTCGCGWPSRSRTRWTRSGWPARPWVSYYARALGAKIGRDVDLHTLPPVTGMLQIGDGAAIEPEVDLSGYWIDGDTVRIGGIRIGAGATVGARSTLAPGARIGPDAEIAPGSAVFGRVRSGQLWAGSPAVRAARAEFGLAGPSVRPISRRLGGGLRRSSAIAFGLLPILAFALGRRRGRVGDARRTRRRHRGAVRGCRGWSPATLVAGVVLGWRDRGRRCGCWRSGWRRGIHPVRSRVGWQAWSTERLLDSARTLLFPLYASLFTPVWLRLLGAEVGQDVEASTVLLIPSMTDDRRRRVPRRRHDGRLLRAARRLDADRAG